MLAATRSTRPSPSEHGRTPCFQRAGRRREIDRRELRGPRTTSPNPHRHLQEILAAQPRAGAR